METSGRLGGVATVVYTNGRWGSRYNFNDSHTGLWTLDFGRSIERKAMHVNDC